MSRGQAFDDFCKCELVLCSPLTRALQTCLVGLGGLLRLRNLSVVMVPQARERLNVGSADSIGCAIGETDILERVKEKTAELFGDASAAAAAIDGIALDDLEVRSRWWSTVPEAEKNVALRIGELMHQVQYSPAKDIVLVGHSHLIREILRTYLSPSFGERAPDLDAQLRKLKLSHCGVAKLSLDFAAGEPPIRDVLLMLDTKLVP